MRSANGVESSHPAIHPDPATLVDRKRPRRVLTGVIRAVAGWIVTIRVRQPSNAAQMSPASACGPVSQLISRRESAATVRSPATACHSLDSLCDRNAEYSPRRIELENGMGSYEVSTN